MLQVFERFKFPFKVNYTNIYTERKKTCNTNSKQQQKNYHFKSQNVTHKTNYITNSLKMKKPTENNEK